MAYPEKTRRSTRRRVAQTVGALAAILAFTAPGVPANALPGDAAIVLKASDMDDDPLDAQAVTQVCTRCHAASQFLGTPRSSTRWEELYGRMSRYGAGGSEEQLNRVVAYFQMNLTLVNVNTSPAEELGPTLQASDETIARVVARRSQRKFTDVKDLISVGGLHAPTIQKLNANGRLQY